MSEEIIGRWFAARPLRSPSGWCWRPRAASPSDPTQRHRLSPRHLTRALDASLGGSGSTPSTSTRCTPTTPDPLEETLRTLDGFVRAGKIGYYGLSNFTGWQLTKAVHWPGRWACAGR